nr:ALPV-088 [Albatrosspox virus]
MNLTPIGYFTTAIIILMYVLSYFKNRNKRL